MSVVRFVAVIVLALFVTACGLVRAVGPDDDRAETFAFVPVPAGQQEAVDALQDTIGPGAQTLDQSTVRPLGKIQTSAGPIIYAEFQVIDSELGRQQCSGHAGPTGGGWGCGPIGQEPPDDLPLPAITLSGGGMSGTWSDVTLTVNDKVAYLEAMAADGTRYRMEPIAGFAWMEWRSSRGEVVITAFDTNGEPLGTVEADAA